MELRIEELKELRIEELKRPTLVAIFVFPLPPPMSLSYLDGVRSRHPELGGAVGDLQNQFRSKYAQRAVF